MFWVKIDRESLASTKICTFLQKWHVFARNVLWNMKFRVSLVSLFKIRTSIICNLWKRGNNVSYFQQRLHLFTQYVSCRAGRYHIFTCVFGAKIRDFQQSHAWTPLKRLYCVPRTFFVKTDRKLSVPPKNIRISSKAASFSKKHVMEYEVPCFTRFAVQNPYFDYSQYEEKRKPCSIFSTAIASDYSICVMQSR